MVHHLLAMEDEQAGEDDDCRADEHLTVRHVAEKGDAEDHGPYQQRVL